MAEIDAYPIGGYNSASRVTQSDLVRYSRFENFPPYLQAMQTVMIYIDHWGNVFHLNGPHAGKEGVQLYQTMQGEQHLPFEQILTESAYQLGATIERFVIHKRIIDFRAYIGRVGMNNLTYRICEDRWWAGQSVIYPGWFGVFTRFSGWRWIQVWPMKTVDTAQKMDPVAYGNNQAVWDIQWIAPRPYYHKPARYKPWRASASGPPKVDPDDGRLYYSGEVPLDNGGDVATSVIYMIEGAGHFKVQDNSSSRMVSGPEVFEEDGLVLVDTDPIEKTITAANDAHDNIFYKIARSAGLLKFLLGGFGERGEAIWRRKYMRFMYQCPPGESTSLTVKHTNPNAVITPVLPQRFQRSR
jgi:hypothetical protein